MRTQGTKTLISGVLGLVLMASLSTLPQQGRALTIEVPDETQYVMVLSYRAGAGMLETEQGNFRITDDTVVMTASGELHSARLRAGSRVAIVETADDERYREPVVLLLWVDDRR